MRPSWGRRRSAMFSSAMILMREVRAACRRRGGALLVVEQPVDGVPHAQAVLEGLDVDVGGVGGQRPVDQEVDEAHDGSLEGHVPEVVDVLLGLGVAVAPGGPHALDDLQ